MWIVWAKYVGRLFTHLSSFFVIFCFLHIQRVANVGIENKSRIKKTKETLAGKLFFFVFLRFFNEKFKNKQTANDCEFFCVMEWTTAMTKKRQTNKNITRKRCTTTCGESRRNREKIWTDKIGHQQATTKRSQIIFKKFLKLEFLVDSFENCQVHRNSKAQFCYFNTKEKQTLNFLGTERVRQTAFK